MNQHFSTLMKNFENAAVELSTHYPRQHAYADKVADSLKQLAIRRAAMERHIAKLNQQENRGT